MIMIYIFPGFTEKMISLILGTFLPGFVLSETAVSMYRDKSG